VRHRGEKNCGDGKSEEREERREGRKEKGGKTMKVYTFFTHAGGAGKTSLARDLGLRTRRGGI
jgi:chromosome partitioning protein